MTNKIHNNNKKRNQVANLQHKLCSWAILVEPLEKEGSLHGEVQVDVVEVFHHKVVVLLRLSQDPFLYWKRICNCFFFYFDLHELPSPRLDQA